MIKLLRFTQVKLSSYAHRGFSKALPNTHLYSSKKLLQCSPVRGIIARNLVTENAKSEKLVGKWLLTCGGMCFVAVVLGGVTRLTESGLSMVTWNLLGEKLPRSHEDWRNEFEKYQQFPEYQMKNMSMTLDEFKFIFTMEYVHRMWGRTIGAVFILPALFFWKRGYFNNHMKKRVMLLGALLGAQGLMGWYMVKSGLEDRFESVNDVPRVSQYRLATHLGMAFILYSLFLSTSLSTLLPTKMIESSCSKVPRFKKIAMFTKGLVFLTAISGAFVAGLDAGLVYNSFPKMADKWIPEDIFVLTPLQKNFTENPTTVQFDHRILGMSTLCLVSGLWLFSKRAHLPKRTQWAVNAIALMAWIQASLGVTTLLTYVPVSLGAAHQSGSLMLLSLAIWLTHELRWVKYVPK